MGRCRWQGLAPTLSLLCLLACTPKSGAVPAVGGLARGGSAQFIADTRGADCRSSLESATCDLGPRLYDVKMSGRVAQLTPSTDSDGNVLHLLLNLREVNRLIIVLTAEQLSGKGFRFKTGDNPSGGFVMRLRLRVPEGADERVGLFERFEEVSLSGTRIDGAPTDYLPIGVCRAAMRTLEFLIELQRMPDTEFHELEFEFFTGALPLTPVARTGGVPVDVEEFSGAWVVDNPLAQPIAALLPDAPSPTHSSFEGWSERGGGMKYVLTLQTVVYPDCTNLEPASGGTVCISSQPSFFYSDNQKDTLTAEDRVSSSDLRVVTLDKLFVNNSRLSAKPFPIALNGTLPPFTDPDFFGVDRIELRMPRTPSAFRDTLRANGAAPPQLSFDFSAGNLSVSTMAKGKDCGDFLSSVRLRFETTDGRYYQAVSRVQDGGIRVEAMPPKGGSPFEALHVNARGGGADSFCLFQFLSSTRIRLHSRLHSPRPSHSLVSAAGPCPLPAPLLYLLAVALPLILLL